MDQGRNVQGKEEGEGMENMDQGLMVQGRKGGKRRTKGREESKNGLAIIF